MMPDYRVVLAGSFMIFRVGSDLPFFMFGFAVMRNGLVFHDDRFFLASVRNPSVSVMMRGFPVRYVPVSYVMVRLCRFRSGNAIRLWLFGGSLRSWREGCADGGIRRSRLGDRSLIAGGGADKHRGGLENRLMYRGYGRRNGRQVRR